MPNAAVLVEANRPLKVVHVDIEPPRQGEVAVRLTASGVCHTDLSVATSSRPIPFPIILGHEGAGVVTAMGPGVEDLAVGDHVVLSAIPQCGTCFFCLRGERTLCELWTKTPFGHQPDGTTRFAMGGQPVYQFSSAGTFTEETVVPSVSAVKIPDSIPLELAALVGCAVVTGYGAATRAASIGADDVVVVVGAGGVGLNVVQGAKLAGARAVVVVDRVPWKLELAARFGATHTVQADDADPREVVRSLTEGRGADIVIEAVGSNATILSALRLARRGGRVVVVGAPPIGSEMTLAFGDEVLRQGRTVVGCLYGNADIRVDFPTLVHLYETGALLLDELVSRRIRLADINEAMDDLHDGKVARSLIVYGDEA